MKRIYSSIANFRDIGGYKGKGGKVKTRIVYRSGNLSKISADETKSLQNRGIKTIIDLRSLSTKQIDPDPLSQDKRFIYRSYFIKAGERLPLDKEDNFSLYQEMLLSKSELLPILKEIISCPKAVLLHCSAGKDRTGIVVSLLLRILEVKISDINREYLLSFDDLNEHLTNLKERNLHISPVYFQKDETFIPLLFSWLNEKFGSIENYYRYLGISDKDIKAIRKMLIEQ